jgi:hypothetical protein
LIGTSPEGRHAVGMKRGGDHAEIQDLRGVQWQDVVLPMQREGKDRQMGDRQMPGLQGIEDLPSL